jgi:tetratricopeptide (TPR) repeat protein
MDRALNKQPTARELRLLLRETELAVANIDQRTPAQDILNLYALCDRIAVALPRIQQAGAQLEPEAVRFEIIWGILRDKAPIIVQTLARDEGLEAYRQQNAPPEDHWWWYLDQYVAQQRAQRRVRLIQRSAIGIAVVAVAVILYVLFLRPDEATRLRYDHQFSGESFVQQGDYAQALTSYQNALELAPEDPELTLVIGVLYEVLEDPENAARQYAEAETKHETRSAFLAARAQQFIRMGRYERAAEDALAATELDDRYALAQCMLGSAYDGLGKNREAIAALWICADLANEQGQDELYVHAKTLLANLMQKPL